MGAMRVLKVVKRFSAAAVAVFLLNVGIMFFSIPETEGVGEKSFGDSHLIVVEYAAAADCVDCPMVSGYLEILYGSPMYDFCYVSLVVDKNEEALERCLELGVESFPTVFFDGGFKSVVGDPEDVEPYVDAFNQCGDRDVHDFDMVAVASMTEASNIYVNVTFWNNECCSGAIYQGFLRVFVTEKVSRWSDENGNPYRFGLLDVAYEGTVIVVHGKPSSVEAVWHPGNYTFDPGNILVIAVVYEDKHGFVTEAATAVPTPPPVDTVILSGPQGVVGERTVRFEWQGLEDGVPSGSLLYSYKLEPYDSGWSPWTTSVSTIYYDLSEGSYVFQVKAKNGLGVVDETPATQVFVVSVSPPVIEVVKPVNGFYVGGEKVFGFPFVFVVGSVDVVVTVSDESGVEEVDFYVDGVLRARRIISPYVYTLSDIGLLRRVVVKVVAVDGVGNQGSEEFMVWKLF